MSTTFSFNFLVLSLLLALRFASSAPILSCSQTPYPRVCAALMRENYSQFPQVKTVSNFRNLAIQATMDRVVLTHQLASSMNVTSLDEPAKSAFADCLVLFEDTIKQLNRSITEASSHEDSQTWLSAAMANLQTCKNGYIDLNASYHFPSSPFTKNNISESLSNSLAINKAMAPATSIKNRRLLSVPSWVSGAVRKLLQSSTAVNANLVVAQDGSGNYKTISEAVAASVNIRRCNSRFVIHVKGGTYNENILITDSMKNLMLIGDGIGVTVVTGSKNVVDGSTTFTTATFAVIGGGFIAQDLTFQNTAGPQKGQAVAFQSASDLSVYYRCSFEGYQDTLHVCSQRQFYRNCDIYGTVDFIFGDAVAIFQSCNMYVRKPLSGQENTVTAQGRSDPNENTGFSIYNSNVAAASELQPVQGSVKSYLGRPWMAYSRTVFMRTSIGCLIDPAGWLEWDGNFGLSTLYYGEYMNTGPRASTCGRVNWPGFHIMSASDAAQFTVGNFLAGDSWIPATGVPYVSGL